MVDGQRTDDGACLYYKLTNEPKGSGELKTVRNKQYVTNIRNNNVFYIYTRIDNYVVERLVYLFTSHIHM